MPVEFSPTEIEAVQVVKCGLSRDDRGFFSESYSDVVWRNRGFEGIFRQDNISLSHKGALRGMHYQLNPDAMGKLVRVIAGAIFDVAVDLRQGSPDFGKWVGRELTGGNGLAIWVPAGFAHGFIALQDATYVYYKCTAVHAPESERSLSYKCPRVAIEWPIAPAIVSAKDEAAPILDDADINFVFGG